MRNYITTTATIPAELAELRSRLALVERDARDNLEAMNDLNEDVRKDIDTIYEAIGALSVKLPQARATPAHRVQEAGDEITNHNIDHLCRYYGIRLDE